MNIDEIDRKVSYTKLRVLYQTLLDRNPNHQEILDHLTKVNAVSTLHELALEILNCPEFADRSGRFGSELIDKLLHTDYDPDNGSRFAAFVPPPTEAGKAYRLRLLEGFFARYCRGDVVLDVGFTGYANPDKKASLPGAIGVDLDYPGYDGLHLPWPDNSVDCVFSSHCLEHVQLYQEVIRDWHRVLKIGGHIVCIVPSRDLYEKKRFPPSRYNGEHKRFYTSGRLIAEFEEALQPNSFRVRHLHENDHDYNYSIGPEEHAVGCYEIELVLQKISEPSWTIE
jgi:SAM-dependent methyltransferase